jgi:hypothetical protein
MFDEPIELDPVLQLPEPGSHAVGHDSGLQCWLHSGSALQSEQRGQHGQRGHSTAREGGRQVVVVF